MDTSHLRTAVASMEDSLVSLTQMLATETAANASNPKATYTVSTSEGSQTIDWNGYRNSLMSQINALQESIKLTRQLINGYDPYVVSTVQYV